MRGIAAVLATMTAVALATTAQDDAHAATAGSGSGAGHPARTTVRLHVTGCAGCTIQLQHAVNGNQHVWTSAEQRIGADHHAVFKVRTSRTRGLSFLIRAPWEGNTGAVSNIVTRYAGHQVDARVSRAAARRASHAEGCWAGTSLDDVRLGFHVSRVKARTLDGQPTQIPLAYATHTMSSWKPSVSTYKGTIGNQDAFWCTKPQATKVTLRASGCDGCQVQLINGALRPENAWDSADKTVAGGSVSFSVPRPLTRGISATVVAPWEGTTGYTTLVAWRYAGHKPGDQVSFAEARSQTRGSACWAGTSRSSVRVALTVRKVQVEGTTGPTAGTIAYARVTQPWLAPMMDAGKGVLGSQEVITCRK
jgi:hypothetical protein